MAGVAVNGAFRSQRTTGQQRYAGEIADRLVAGGAREFRPGGFWGGSAVRSWLWTLLILPLRSRRHVLVSLTARAPLLHPRHILAVHDLFVLTNPEWYSTRYVRTHAPVLRWQLRTARALTAVSEPVADQLAVYRSGRPLVIAPNAPSDVFAAAQPDAAVLDQLGLVAGSYAVTVGNRDPRKNLPQLARAWAAVPEQLRASMPLVVIGGGESIYRQEDTSWPTGTVVTGYVPDSELASLYAAARAIVFVSRAEGFGLPIVEAAAAGVPRFVLSDLAVFRWVAGDAAVYVDPVRMDSIAEALIRLAGSPWQPSALDVSRFDWDVSAGRVLGLASRLKPRGRSQSPA